MFKSTATFSVLAGLLFAAACARPVVPETRDGSVEFVLSEASDAEGSLPSRLTITGLDRSFHALVELPSDPAASDFRVELPAGLYAVDAAASVSDAEPVIPASSAPKLVVVAAGRVSTVNVRNAGSEQPAVAVLGAAFER